jgi:hypothetical protein
LSASESPVKPSIRSEQKTTAEVRLDLLKDDRIGTVARGPDGSQDRTMAWTIELLNAPRLLCLFRT